jgi:hypothetical protein
LRRFREAFAPMLRGRVRIRGVLPAMVGAVILSMSLVGVAIGTASAQETRADAIAERQAATAARLAPPKAQPVEGLLVRIEEEQWFTGVPRGFFPFFGNMMPGAGFALGVAHRTYTGPSGWIQGRASYSVRNFKLVEGETTYPALASGRLALGARVRWSDAPSLIFNGLGSHSPRDRASFRLRQTPSTPCPTRHGSRTASARER